MSPKTTPSAAIDIAARLVCRWSSPDGGSGSDGDTVSSAALGIVESLVGAFDEVDRVVRERALGDGHAEADRHRYLEVHVPHRVALDEDPQRLGEDAGAGLGRVGQD